jgi:hypothetical protein
VIKTTDIIIYTRPETLKHKKTDGPRPNAYCFWELPNLPAKIRNVIEEPMDNMDRVGYHSEKLISDIFLDNPMCVIDHNIRLYFAVNKQIVGYFPIIAIAYPGLDLGPENYEFRFHSDDWKDLDEPIPTKPFQGFKYADKIPELKR